MCVTKGGRGADGAQSADRFAALSRGGNGVGRRRVGGKARAQPCGVCVEDAREGPLTSRRVTEMSSGPDLKRCVCFTTASM